MVEITFSNIFKRHLPCPAIRVEATDLWTALEQAYVQTPGLRGYVLDDQDRLRQHVTLFLDGAMLTDRTNLRQPIPPNCKIHLFQALSGG